MNEVFSNFRHMFLYLVLYTCFYFVVISATDGRLARSSSFSPSILGNLEFIKKVQ